MSRARVAADPDMERIRADIRMIRHMLAALIALTACSGLVLLAIAERIGVKLGALP